MIRNLLYGLFFVSISSLHATSIFNFDSDAVGTYTPFTDTNNGISATFVSNGDPGGFAIYPSVFSTLTGNVLLDPGPANSDSLALTVNFSQDLKDISLDFAINPLTSSDTFSMAAYQGNTLVGSTTVTGSTPPASSSAPPGVSFPEGTAAFSGAAFNTVVLSSTGLDFGVDNISVDATSMPEPGSLPLVGVAGILLSGVIAAYRRKRGARQP